MYYIYAYLREDGSPYYIGKGKGKRAWNSNHRINLPKDSSRIIIMERGLTNVGACALERRYIRWYGRKDLETGVLRNLTDGGEGATNMRVSDSTKKKLSEINKGKVLSEDHKRKQSLAKLGKPCSEEHKRNTSIGMTGKKRPPRSEETKKKIAEANRKTWSEKVKHGWKPIWLRDTK